MGVVCGSRKIEPESRAVQAALVGPKTSGKSALITCFMAHKFRPEYHPTYTPNIGVKAFTFENAPQVVTLEVWEFGDVKDVPKNFNVVLVALDAGFRTGSGSFLMNGTASYR